MSMNPTKINEYLDIMNAGENADYAYLSENIRKIMPHVPDRLKAEFEWLLATLHTDMVKLHSTIKNLQEALRDASKQIQDTIR